MSFDSYVGVCQDCGHKFHAIEEGDLLCPVCAVKKEGSGATIEKVAAHPDGPVEGVEIIIMDEIEPKPFLKKRIHIRVEGTDREFTYDVDPDKDFDGQVKDAIDQSEKIMRTAGLVATAMAMKGIEPDATIIPYFKVMDDAHDVLASPHVVRCEAAERLSEVRATLLVNYGPEGIKHNDIEVKKDKSVLKMLIDVIEQYSHRVDKLEAMRPMHEDQVVTQGALNALIGQRDIAWCVRYKDRATVLGALHRLHIDTESDTIPGSVLRAWIKEEEEKIPPEPECKTIIHAMAEHPDEVAKLVAHILRWYGGMQGGGLLATGSADKEVKALGAWMRENGYEFEEFT